MFTSNPFATLSETIPLIAIQSFVFVMVGLVVFGTVLDTFLITQKKQKSLPKKNLVVEKEF